LIASASRFSLDTASRQTCLECGARDKLVAQTFDVRSYLSQERGPRAPADSAITIERSRSQAAGAVNLLGGG
jgi:hypothetical protein